MSDKSFRNILITGANRGIGLEFAKQYADDCEKLYACARHPETAEDLQRLAADHDNVEVLQLDVTDGAQLDRLADYLKGQSVDLLINNAGVLGPSPDEWPLDQAAWRRVLEVNTIAPMRVATAMMDSLEQDGGAVMANITSKMGSIGDNESGKAHIYRSSKAGLNAAMKSLAIDKKDDNLVVLLLHPGWVKTAMGGPNALIDVKTSVDGMKRIIDQADLKDSGNFFDYSGSIIPW